MVKSTKQRKSTTKIKMLFFLILLPFAVHAAKTYGTCGTQLNISSGGYGIQSTTFDLSGITGESVT